MRYIAWMLVVAAALFVALCYPAQACTVTLFGEIDMKMAQDVAAQIYVCDNQDDHTTLYINSPGGSVIAGGIVVDAMRLAKHPVNTVNIGAAESMAAIIFEYATGRSIVWPHSFLMLHNAHLSLSGTPGQVATEAKVYGSYVAEYEAKMAERAGMSLAAFRKLANDEWYLRADEAVKAGMADEVAKEMGVKP